MGETLNINGHLGKKSLNRHHSSQWQFQIALQEIHHRFSGNRLSLFGPQQNLDIALDLLDQLPSAKAKFKFANVGMPS